MGAPAYIYGDTVQSCLNVARSRVDDLLITPAGSPAGQVGGGTLLRTLEENGTSVTPWTPVMFNAAWRKYQQELLVLGWRGLIDTIVIPAMPANAAADVTIQSWLSWNGCFDGVTVRTVPALPKEFIAPLKLRERISAVPLSPFTAMDTALDGLRNVPTRSALNRQWEWRKNALWFIGATQPTDLQIRCESFYPDFTATTAPVVPWYGQPIPIPRSLSALAWYVAIEVAFPRGDEAGFATAMQQASAETAMVFGSQGRADNRMPAAAPAPEVVVQ